MIAGISLFIAWFPDIVTSIINRTSLELIEVYTTEITYVPDMGIMLPIQSVFQLFGGISIPFPALITKIFIFVILAVFAVYFEYYLKRKTQYIEA